MVELIGIYLVSGRMRKTADHCLVNSIRMEYFWVALMLLPCILLNSSNGAAVTNFYHSFTNKKFGGDSTCVTATDVSSSSGVEGDQKKAEKKDNLFWMRWSLPKINKRKMSWTFLHFPLISP